MVCVDIASKEEMQKPDDNINDRMVEFLAKDNNAMRKAGCALAEAAMYVVGNYDGLHRLSLAVAEWSKTIANEGGRPHGTKDTSDD